MNCWPLLVLSFTISTGAAFDDASPGSVRAAAGRGTLTPVAGERVAFRASRASAFQAFRAVASVTPAVGAAAPQTADLAAVRDLIAAGKYLEGEEAALKAVAQIETARGASAIEVADAIDLVLQARRLGRRLPTAGTVALAERALAIREAALGADDVSVANTLVLLGLGYSANREHARAKQAIERAIAIRERAADGDEIALAAALNALASARRSAAQPAEAAAAAERALAVARRVEQPPGNETASALSALSIASRMRGDLEGAVRLSEEVLAIDERLRGPDHPSLAGSLVVLSGALWDLGDTERSRALHERAIRLLEASPGNERRLAFEYVSLASKLENMGDYANGFALAERGVAAAERTSGAESALTAAALDQLAQMQTHLGDRPAARATRERAAAIWREAQGPDSVHVATALNGIAESFEEAGELDAAFEVVERALRIQALAQQPAVYSRVLQTHGRLLAARGQRAEARVSFERAREVSAAAPFATARTDLAMTLTLLARLDRDEGQPARALPRYREAIALFEQELGPTHIRTAERRTEYAAALAEAGDIAQARIELAAGERASVEHLRLVARTLSDRRALEFAADRRSGVDLAVTLATRAPGRTAAQTQDDWQMVIRARTVVLDEMAARQRTVVSEADQAGVRERWAAVTHARARLANLIIRGGEGMAPEQYQALVTRTSTERDAAERDLARASLSFRQEQQRVRASAPEVLARLPAGAALVSFVRYTPQRLAGDPPDAGGTPPAAGAADRTAYAAFIARAGVALRVVALGPARDLDEAIAAWRAGIQAELNAGGLGGRRTEADYRAAGAALRTRLWDPVRPHLGAATSVFIVPDGAIHLVDFSTLPIGTTGYLVQEPITLHYLLAERDLVQAAPPPSGRRLLALGAADFDSLTTESEGPASTAEATSTSSPTSTSTATASSPASSIATSTATAISPVASTPATTANAAGTAAPRTASAATPSTHTAAPQTASHTASTAPHTASGGATPGASTESRSPHATAASRNATPAASAAPDTAAPASSHAAIAVGARNTSASSIDSAPLADATASGVAAALAGAATRQAGAGCDSFARRTFAPLPATEIEMQQIADIWRHRSPTGSGTSTSPSPNTNDGRAAGSRGTARTPARGAAAERSPQPRSDADRHATGSNDTGRNSADSTTLAGRDLVLLEGGGATEAAFKALAHDRRVLHLATHGFFLDRFCAPETGMASAADATPPAPQTAAAATAALTTAAGADAAMSGKIASASPVSTTPASTTPASTTAAPTPPAFAPTPENAPARPEPALTRSASPAPVSGTSPAAAATDPGANVSNAGAARADVPRDPAPAAIARPVSPLEESPLLRSGLVLAGANQRARRGRDEEDGILTAEEIAGLDLSATQWAVLSACDTGRGDWQAGEGVVGLRRAFLVAGARTVILSLWPVIDTVAADWMTELYRGKFVRDVTTGSAARAASRTLLARRRAAGASTHPLYWAGFLATGDWH